MAKKHYDNKLFFIAELRWGTRLFPVLAKHKNVALQMLAKQRGLKSEKELWRKMFAEGEDFIEIEDKAALDDFCEKYPDPYFIRTLRKMVEGEPLFS